MRHRSLVLTLGLLLAALAVASCGGAAADETYTDPFEYCAAVGTIDAPDAAYTGEAMPETVALGLQTAMNVPDTPLEMLQGGSSWRCVDGKVLACFVGANLPCEARANLDKTPAQEMADFCTANPDSDFIPAVATGRETVYEWRCNGSTPEVVRQVSQVDGQGFFADIWYVIGE